MAAAKAVLPDRANKAHNGHTVDLAGMHKNPRHDNEPRKVNCFNSRPRKELLFARREIAATTIACNATDAEYVYRENDAVLISHVGVLVHASV